MRKARSFEVKDEALEALKSANGGRLPTDVSRNAHLSTLQCHICLFAMVTAELEHGDDQLVMSLVQKMRIINTMASGKLQDTVENLGLDRRSSRLRQNTQLSKQECTKQIVNFILAKYPGR